MRALILAAGRGERLRPHTDDRPKCLVPLAGRPLLDWQLAALGECGIDEIGMTTGYRAEALQVRGARLWHNSRWAETNMVASLLCAREWLEAGVPLLVAYSDIVYEPRIVRALLDSKHDVSVTVDLEWLDLWRARFDDPLADAESLRVSADGAIVDIGRRVDRLADIQAQYMGLLRFSAAGLGQLLRTCDAAREARLGGSPADRAAMTDLLRQLIEEGVRVAAVPVRRGWLEVDSTSDLAVYERWFHEGVLDRFFAPTATRMRAW